MKSEDYEINIEELAHDVGKISDFLMLSLEKQSKGYRKNKNNGKNTEGDGFKKKMRSISAAQSPKNMKKE